MNFKILEFWFETNIEKLPKENVKLYDHVTINNPKLFVKSHIEAIRNNPGNKTFMPYYLRLLDFYNLINKKK